MLKSKEEPILYQFLQDISETIMDMCWKNSKLPEEQKNDFNEKERVLAYKTACLDFIADIILHQGEEPEWLAFLYASISNRYDAALRDVLTYREWRDI
jgi:hypothetical protein